MNAAQDEIDGNAASADVLWVPEPGACGGRIDPDQLLIPSWLASQLDWHLRPSASPWATTPMARTSCAHVDWLMVWETDPDLFRRRAQLGVPPLADLGQARAALAELGFELVLEVQVERIAGDLGLAIYGAGVAGSLSAEGWRVAASWLTTCCCTIREPRDGRSLDLLAPTGPTAPGGGQHRHPAVAPLGWWIGDWSHTWWSYPVAGPLRPGCTCAAHAVAEPFGPGHASTQSE